MAKTILIIDDDDRFRTALSAVLENAGYSVVEAGDGKAAIAAIERLRDAIDLMVVDICLPDMNGLEIIGAVRRRPNLIKVIATSGVFNEMFLEVATTVGANVGLRKPASGEQPPAGQWIQTVRGLLGETGEAPERARRKVILLVAQDPAERGYLASVLQNDGFQVLQTSHGDDALALFEKVGGAVDALIAETQGKPAGEGVVACAVRSEAPNVPVLYIGAGCEALREMHDPAGKVICLPELPGPSALLEAVKRLLG